MDPLLRPTLALALLCQTPAGCAKISPNPDSAPRPAGVAVAPAAAAFSGPADRPLPGVPLTHLCVTAGRIAPLDAQRAKVNLAGMRAVVAGSAGSAAEVAFTYLGPSRSVARLGNGELRRQIGLKLRAQDTCNVVYVMWHAEPSQGIFVSVKHNPHMSKNEECGPNGYINVKPEFSNQPPSLLAGAPHTLRAELDGNALRVSADGVLAWHGPLPVEAFTFDGPAGIRSDNGEFDFEFRVALGVGVTASCPGLSAGD